MNLDYSLLTIMGQFVMDESLTRTCDAFVQTQTGILVQHRISAVI